MSSEQEQIRSVAERIARRLSVADARAQAPSAEAQEGDDLKALRSALAEIQQRLAHIESHLAHDDSCAEEAGSEKTTHTQGDETSRPRQTQAASATPQQTPPPRSTWLSGTYVPATSHPSQERFGINDAVSELVDFFEREKVCGIEPGNKPCDQCGVCSSRGF